MGAPDACTDPSDADLVKRVLEGDEGAFALLYQRHARIIAYRIARYVSTQADVEDILQTVFLEVHRSLARFDSSRSFQAWLHGIAVRTVQGHFRTQKRKFWRSVFKRVPTEDRDLVDVSSIEGHDAIVRRDMVKQVYALLDTFPAEQRMTYIMHDIEGIGVTELGKLLDLSPQAVHARVKRIRKKIKSLLSADGNKRKLNDKDG